MFLLVCIIIFVGCCHGCTLPSQTASTNVNRLVEGLTNFSVEFLARTANEGGDHNIILSSYSVWILLVILNAGANGVTSSQLKNVLKIPSDENVFRSGLKTLEDALMCKSPGVEIDLANAIFIDKTKKLKQEFQNHVTMQYKVSLQPLNFTDPLTSVNYVDSYINKVTKGKIKHFINYDDFKNAQLLLTTAIYFKGVWNLPFNHTSTIITDFYDETLTHSRGQVSMMYQIGSFTYTKLSKLKAHIIELPYGENERYSMLIILPVKNILLSDFLNQLTTTQMGQIFDDLERAKTDFFGEDVQVYLPKFSISSDYTMNLILEKMGILDLFSPEYADLSNMSADNLYLSRVIHKATIDVDEEGTVASAVSGGTISYKSPPAIFNASHPFVYFIVEMTTRTILFLGTFSKPDAN